MLSLVKELIGKYLPPICKSAPYNWRIFIDFAPKGPQKRLHILVRRTFFSKKPIYDCNSKLNDEVPAEVGFSM